MVRQAHHERFRVPGDFLDSGFRRNDGSWGGFVTRPYRYSIPGLQPFDRFGYRPAYRFSWGTI